MGFANRTETRFPSQGRFASHGGFLPAIFAACLQFPPPSGPEYPPSTLQRFGALLLALVMVVTLVLMALPAKLSRRILRIVFCLGKNRP
jgi:hypothetical protein